MISDQEEKALIKVGEEHIRLVEMLKNALRIAQAGFLRAGQVLSIIKEKRTYRGEDLSHEWNWADFCARPDLPIPGRTEESRRRTADALVRVYQVFVLKLKYPKETLTPIGWTKLDLIAPICEVEDKESIEEWLSKALTLSLRDLRIVLKGKGIDDTCRHENEYPRFYCPKCGSSSRFPLNKKHKEIPESSWKKYGTQ